MTNDNKTSTGDVDKNSLIQKYTINCVPKIDDIFIDNLINLLNALKDNLVNAQKSELNNDSIFCSSNALPSVADTVRKYTYNRIVLKLFESLISNVPSDDKQFLFKILNYHENGLAHQFNMMCNKLFAHVENFEDEYLEYQMDNDDDYDELQELYD